MILVVTIFPINLPLSDYSELGCNRFLNFIHHRVIKSNTQKSCFHLKHVVRLETVAVSSLFWASFVETENGNENGALHIHSTLFPTTSWWQQCRIILMLGRAICPSQQIIRWFYNSAINPCTKRWVHWLDSNSHCKNKLQRTKRLIGAGRQLQAHGRRMLT